MIDNRGKLDLTKIIDDNNILIDELRSKLKAKCNDVLKLRKELDLANEEHQLCQLRYNKLKEAIDKASKDHLNKLRKEDM